MSIPLLTSESVKQGSQIQEQEQRARMRDMSAEEERLIKSINELKIAEQEEKDRVKEDVAEFRNKAHIEVVEIDNVIVGKKREVEALEVRREEAMKPIEEVRKEADERNAKSKEREEAAALLEKELNDRDEVSLNEIEKFEDRKQLQNEREENLDKREEKVKAEEAISKESLAGVNKRWAEFHEVVAVKEKEFDTREAAVNAGEQANLAKAEELEKVSNEQSHQHRQIADKYETLGRARAEFERMQQNHDPS